MEFFAIRYELPGDAPQVEPVRFVFAEDGPSMLASAIGTGPSVGSSVVVTERTTVATGTAFAPFVPPDITPQSPAPHKKRGDPARISRAVFDVRRTVDDNN